MKLRISTKNQGLDVSVADENGNKIEDVKKITIKPFCPGEEFIVAKIECVLDAIDVECYEKT